MTFFFLLRTTRRFFFITAATWFLFSPLFLPFEESVAFWVVFAQGIVFTYFLYNMYLYLGTVWYTVLKQRMSVLLSDSFWTKFNSTRIIMMQYLQLFLIYLIKHYLRNSALFLHNIKFWVQIKKCLIINKWIKHFI